MWASDCDLVFEGVLLCLQVLCNISADALNLHIMIGIKSDLGKCLNVRQHLHVEVEWHI
jgi:hypothetical protein